MTDKNITKLDPSSGSKIKSVAPDVGLWELFYVFLRIGTLTFGGGLVMASVIRHEMLCKKWMSDEEFVDYMAIATSVPGTIASNLSLLLGYRIKGVPGALLAMSGVVLPSFVSILLIALMITGNMDNPYISSFLRGSGAGIVGLVVYTALAMGKKVIKSFKHILLVILCLLMLVVLKLHPLPVIIISGFIGYFLVGDMKEGNEGMEEKLGKNLVCMKEGDQDKNQPYIKEKESDKNNSIKEREPDKSQNNVGEKI